MIKARQRWRTFTGWQFDVIGVRGTHVECEWIEDKTSFCLSLGSFESRIGSERFPRYYLESE